MSAGDDALIRATKRFLDGPFKSLWLYEQECQVYVRKSVKLYPTTQVPYSTFEIANISVNPGFRGKGLFTTWVEELDSLVDKYNLEALYVENILTNRFCRWFERRPEWIRTSHSVPSYMKLITDTPISLDK